MNLFNRKPDSSGNCKNSNSSYPLQKIVNFGQVGVNLEVDTAVCRGTFNEITASLFSEPRAEGQTAGQ